MLSYRLPTLTLIVASLSCSSGLLAARPSGERVELFAAVEAEQVELKVVPKDATEATVMVKNKSGRPLSIQLPAAFVGMPVLAQNIGGNNAGGGNSSNSSSNQSFGGGGMGGMGMGGMGMGGGFFDVGPDRVMKIKFKTVCLEHGKQDPSPRVAYTLRPISDFTDNAQLAEVCKMLGRGEIDQVSAQAAAWHLSDGLSWPELARKVRIKHLNGQIEPFFNTQQLQAAARAVQVAHRRAEQGPDSPGDVAQQAAAHSPGESLSLTK